MNFKKQRQLGEIPEIDITPMLNIVMVVLAFFVAISATLTGESETVDVTLPKPKPLENAVSEPQSEPPLVLNVELTSEGELTADDRPIEKDKLLSQIPGYLENYPDSKIYFKPNTGVTYETVLQTLAELKQVGGDRITLAIGTTQSLDNREANED